MENRNNKNYLNQKDNCDGANAPHNIWLDNNYISSNDVIKHKVEVTGNFLETWEFETGLYVSPKKRSVRTYNPNNIQKGNYRAVSTIKKLIAGNFYSKNTKFMSMTFNNENKFNTKNLRICNTRKQTFIKKLQKFYCNFTYLIVPEYQKRGVVHYHMISNLPYINKEELEKIWGYGYCNISSVRRTDSIASYVTKKFVSKISSYVTKNIKEVSFKGYRRYYCSNSLARPEKFYNNEADKLVDFCMNRKHEFVEERKFYMNYIGYVVYRSYFIKKKVTLSDMDWAVYGYDGKD